MYGEHMEVLTAAAAIVIAPSGGESTISLF